MDIGQLIVYITVVIYKGNNKLLYYMPLNNYFYTKTKTMCKYIPLKIPIGSPTPYPVQLYTKLKPTQYAWVENASGETMPNVTIIRERENGCIVRLLVNIAGSGVTDETVYLNISK